MRIQNTMIERKQLNKRIKQAREDNDTELVIMLEHLLQLKFSWVEQIKKRFLGPNPNGSYTPHQSVLREEVVREWAKKYKII